VKQKKLLTKQSWWRELSWASGVEDLARGVGEEWREDEEAARGIIPGGKL
jgi:hypothetical protein